MSPLKQAVKPHESQLKHAEERKKTRKRLVTQVMDINAQNAIRLLPGELTLSTRIILETCMDHLITNAPTSEGLFRSPSISLRNAPFFPYFPLLFVSPESVSTSVSFWE